MEKEKGRCRKKIDFKIDIGKLHLVCKVYRIENDFSESCFQPYA